MLSCKHQPVDKSATPTTIPIVGLGPILIIVARNEASLSIQLPSDAKGSYSKARQESVPGFYDLQQYQDLLFTCEEAPSVLLGAGDQSGTFA